MTHIVNDPAEFREDMLAGFLDAYPEFAIGVKGGVVRARASSPGKVSIVVGGGSGHYPAFHGIVGPGFADGAVVGNIFTSPSQSDAISVCRAAQNGGGVLLMAGNYAGDVMNFGQAATQLTAEGIETVTVFVTDDIASASADEVTKRRGIAGDFTVFKLASAAAEEGRPLAEVVEIAHRANDLTRTLGVAFDGATMPGATSGLFVIEPGQMEIGLGIHGEPGVDDVPLANADAVAGVLVDGVLAEHPASESHRIAVVLNGLGATKYEELFVLWAAIAPRLRAHGYEIVSPEIGELITSLDMAGCSLTLTWLDDDLERYWLAPAMTPAYRRGSVDTTTTALRVVSPDAHSADVGTVAVAGEEAEAARRVVAMLGAAASAIAENEAALGALDAIAGDGDHGRGMRRGVDAAVEAATSSAASGASASQVLGAAGAAWADRAGGSSGVLWGAALMAAAGRLGSGAEDSEAIVAAVRAAADAIATLGKAELGDKTMLDALIPFSDRLAYGVAGGEPLRTAWRMAAETAGDAAKATSILRPRIGRARPLAAKSVGHPDPGAVSFALIVSALASLYEPRSGSAIDPAQVNEMRNH